jgi:CO dehydrogenase maturation factor
MRLTLKVIAITGKGGTGKTAVAAMLIRSLVDRDMTILAVDADPDTNLPEVLGDTVEETVGDQREFMLKERDNLPPDTDKQRILESRIYSILAERHGYDLLVMGRPDGPGCYCFTNNLLRGIMDRIVNNYDLTIIDTAAGLEHLSRRIIHDVDTLIIVTDGSKRGLQTAHRIRELAGELELNIKHMYVILNKVTPQNKERLIKSAQDLELDLAGMIPYDETISRFDLEGRPLIELPGNSPAQLEIENVIMKLGM